MFHRFGRRLYSRLDNYFRNSPPYYMTGMLISVNLGVWAGWNFLNPSFMHQHFVMSEFNTVHKQRYYTILTSSVSHDSTLHLAVNMLGLWFFGRHVEMILGSTALLTLYLAGAFGGFAALWWKYKGGPRKWVIPEVLGATASTAAIFTFYVCMDPWATVVFFIFPMPTILAGLIVLGLSTMKGNGPVAESGHLGGAVNGGLCYLLRKSLFKL